MNLSTRIKDVILKNSYDSMLTVTTTELAGQIASLFDNPAELGRPKIVCLCGSTRFYQAFQQANYDETLKGNIVLSVGFYPHASAEAHGQNIGCDDETKQRLDQLHLRKIDLADEILVLNVGDYIGSSTRNEINYAIKTGKGVRFLVATQQAIFSRSA